MKDLSLHLMDIVQNSIAAQATLIHITLAHHEGILTLRVSDNGSGMEPELKEAVTDPFITSRTTRKVGLGIPLLKHSADMTGGALRIESQKGIGTMIEAHFLVASIDRIPIGEVDETMKTLIYANPELDFELLLETEQNRYELKTTELKRVLNGVPIHHADVIEWIGMNIREGLKEIFGGVLDEVSS